MRGQTPAPGPQQGATGAGIDPRGSRFAAALTVLLLAAAVVLGNGPAAQATLGLAVLSFALGTVLGVPRTWQGVLYRHVLRPRLGPPRELEDPGPPRFAQLVGLLITGAGLAFSLAGAGWAIPVFGSLALVAAFLNAAFGLCLGCEMYLLGRRLGSRRA